MSIVLRFTDPQTLYRLKHISRRSEFLIRAMGHQDKADTHIIDATAGFGQDSIILAAAGFRVTMIERSQAVYELLTNALNEASTHPLLKSYTSRLTLYHGEAISYLNNSLSSAPDIVYLDPMYPPKQKNAASKKSMQFLQSLLINDIDNSEELLAMALSCAKKRVVVKRPRLAAPLTGHKPSFSIIGKSSRFDIYVITT
jgi:16S rRNA (guanine1516-N2)-methyltransferase